MRDPGEGMLDIWIESPDGQRLSFTQSDNSGDAIVQRLPAG
jgi:hypothetical protein